MNVYMMIQTLNISISKEVAIFRGSKNYAENTPSKKKKEKYF